MKKFRADLESDARDGQSRHMQLGNEKKIH